ncbi:MAG: hypothetical protein LC792_13515 [Actinobacteria bacterium]|nr:hypothetical protein [Actinomycetota bacterium]
MPDAERCSGIPTQQRTVSEPPPVAVVVLVDVDVDVVLSPAIEEVHACDGSDTMAFIAVKKTAVSALPITLARVLAIPDSIAPIADDHDETHGRIDSSVPLRPVLADSPEPHHGNSWSPDATSSVQRWTSARQCLSSKLNPLSLYSGALDGLD